MNFPEICSEASNRLSGLSKLANELDALLLNLEDDRKNTDVLTSMVQKIYEAGSLSEDLLYQYIPAMEAEEPAIAIAVRIAHQELSRRVSGARQDLEVLAKRSDHRREGVRLRRVG